jgi:thiamine pyrophosphokinase
LKYLTERGIKCESVSERETVCCFGQGEHGLSGNVGKTFSVIPAFCDSVVVSYRGDVEYPAEGLKLSGSLTVGVSNIFRSDENSIVVESGVAFVLINNCV